MFKKGLLTISILCASIMCTTIPTLAEEPVEIEVQGAYVPVNYETVAYASRITATGHYEVVNGTATNIYLEVRIDGIVTHDFVVTVVGSGIKVEVYWSPTVSDYHSITFYA